ACFLLKLMGGGVWSFSAGPAGRRRKISCREFWGLRPPHPGILAGVTHPRTPGSTFGRPKVNRKTAKTNGFGFLCLIGLYQDRNFSATESGFCHLIYSGSIDDTSPAVRVGTSSASLILPQATGFARCAVPPSSSANAPL